jgi:hypothetical protein
MSEQLYGLEEREHSAGYSPMPLAHPLPREEFDTPSPAPDDKYSALSPQEAAKELVQNRAFQPDQPTEDRELPPVEEPAIVRQYSRQGGEHAGETMPANETVSAEQAAHDLFLAREQDALATKTAADAELRQAVDALRADQQQPVAEQPAQPEVPQPEAQPAQEDRNQKIQRMLQDPDFLAAAQESIQAQAQQAEQARQTYEQAVLQNANVTLANISARYPELRNVGLDQWPTVLQTLQTSNPQRFQQISQELQGTRANLEQAAQVMASQQQQYQQQLNQAASTAAQRFNAAARDADADFSDYAKAQNVSDGQLKEIRAEAFAMLRESMTVEQIAAEYNSNWLFRSAQSQRILMDAARYRLAQKNLAKNAAQKPVPPVQRPGQGRADFVDARDASTRELSAKLTHDGTLKSATELLIARRQNRR